MKHAASLPRRMYWSTDVGGVAQCPECRGRLDRQSQCYALAVRHGEDMRMSVVGNDGGHFCRQCPVIVLDKAVFSEFAHLEVRNKVDSKFLVMGLVDIDAVPEEKRNRPFVEPDNPIPLVKFTNLSSPASHPRSALTRLPRANDYCPCGSGRKFKKCCALEHGTANNASHATEEPAPGAGSSAREG